MSVDEPPSFVPDIVSGVATIPTGYETIFNWDYRVKSADLRKLYEKAKEAQWDASTWLRWETDVDPEAENSPDETIAIFGTPLWDKLDKKRELPRLRRELGAWTLSNFLHGEQGALIATAQLVSCVPTADAKLYAATQVVDEARHVEAYDRYLREKYEIVYPISPHLEELLGLVVTDSRWDMKYLGMQIMIEGLALAAFGTILQTSREPLIKEIIHMIMRDEARHVAFGVLSLRGAYDEMKPSELRDREDFVIESSRLMRDRFLGQEVWERMGMPVRECLELSLHSDRMKLFRQLLFSKIVPNIKRLGLLTPRVRRGFTELGVIHFEGWEPTA